MSGSKKAIIGVIVICGVFLSQMAVFWGLDTIAKQALLPDIVFEQPYKLQGAAEDFQGGGLSANGRYLAWINMGILQVEDLVARRSCYVGTEETEVFVWLPDRSSLLFLAGEQLYSLNLEGDMRLQRETEAFLPAYTYSHIGVSTYTNVIYLMGKTPEGEQGVFKMDLMKNLVWLESPPGIVLSRIYVSNKTGAVMAQGETEEGPRLFCLENEMWSVWKPESEPVFRDGDAEERALVEGDGADSGISYVLWGADDGGFYAGATQNEVGRASDLERQNGVLPGGEWELLYFPVEGFGKVDHSSVALWRGTLPALSEFLPFAVGAGFLVPEEETGSGNFLVRKMIWEANRNVGSMETYALGAPLLQEERGQSLYHVFASNGLTYLEIRGGMYCWRLLAK